MKKLILRLLNPMEWIRARKFAKATGQFDKSQFDLELYLYSRILRNDMLHYGYFDDPDVSPDDISFNMLEQAQIRYAEKIVSFINNEKDKVLDIGCGMGGLSALMHQKGLIVEPLSPNNRQIEYIKHKWPMLKTHQCKFEALSPKAEFGTLINSESIQYIDLATAFAQANKLAVSGARWIIVDYFRLHDKGINQSSHLLTDFLNAIEPNGWQIVYQEDISKNVLPTLKFANMFADRFLEPLKHFGFEKLRFKQPFWYLMLSGIREGIDKKIAKERASIDPDKFSSEKQYLFFVLEKQQ